MMSESASNTKKNEKTGDKAEPMIDDAILSVETTTGGASNASRPPTFSNKNNPKNKNLKDANFAL